MNDDPLKDCPNCGQPQLRKVINSAGVVFKGSGFYVTDNRNGSSGSNSSSEKPTNSEKTESEKTESSSTKTESTAEPGKAKESAKSTEKSTAPAN